MSAMQNIMEHVIHRIPGEPIQPRKEKQGYVDLKHLSSIELLELIERQNKLFSNRAFVSKLPDKGAKILSFKEQLEKEKEKRNEDKGEGEVLVNSMSRLNLGDRQRRTETDRLEWMGFCDPGYHVDKKSSIVGVREDDVLATDPDPLKLIATHSGTTFHKKLHRVYEDTEELLIQPSDIEVLKSDSPIEDRENQMKADKNTKLSTSKEVNLENEDARAIKRVFTEEPYIKSLCKKFDTCQKLQPKERYLPHRTLRPKFETEKNKIQFIKPLPPKWEVTAATPPPPLHGDTKMLSLTESVELQLEQAKKLEEIQMKHAREKLKTLSKSVGIGMPGKGSSKWTYREHKGDVFSSDEDDVYEDCCDGDGDDTVDGEKKAGGGVVFYNLIDN